MEKRELNITPDMIAGNESLEDLIENKAFDVTDVFLADEFINRAKEFYGGEDENASIKMDVSIDSIRERIEEGINKRKNDLPDESADDFDERLERIAKEELEKALEGLDGQKAGEGDDIFEIPSEFTKAAKNLVSGGGQDGGKKNVSQAQKPQEPQGQKKPMVKVVGQVDLSQIQGSQKKQKPADTAAGKVALHAQEPLSVKTVDADEIDLEDMEPQERKEEFEKRFKPGELYRSYIKSGKKKVLDMIEIGEYLPDPEDPKKDRVTVAVGKDEKGRGRRETFLIDDFEEKFGKYKLVGETLKVIDREKEKKKKEVSKISNVKKEFGEEGTMYTLVDDEGVVADRLIISAFVLKKTKGKKVSNLVSKIEAIVGNKADGSEIKKKFSISELRKKLESGNYSKQERLSEKDVEKQEKRRNKFIEVYGKDVEYIKSDKNGVFERSFHLVDFIGGKESKDDRVKIETGEGKTSLITVDALKYLIVQGYRLSGDQGDDTKAFLEAMKSLKSDQIKKDAGVIWKEGKTTEVPWKDGEERMLMTERRKNFFNRRYANGLEIADKEKGLVFVVDGYEADKETLRKDKVKMSVHYLTDDGKRGEFKEKVEFEIEKFSKRFDPLIKVSETFSLGTPRDDLERIKSKKERRAREKKEKLVVDEEIVKDYIAIAEKMIEKIEGYDYVGEYGYSSAEVLDAIEETKEMFWEKLIEELKKDKRVGKDKEEIVADEVRRRIEEKKLKKYSIPYIENKMKELEKMVTDVSGRIGDEEFSRDSQIFLEEFRKEFENIKSNKESRQYQEKFCDRIEKEMKDLRAAVLKFEAEGDLK